jgi:hypothetical protein
MDDVYAGKGFKATNRNINCLQLKAAVDRMREK